MEGRPRVEPGRIALLDLMVVVAGVAVGFALWPIKRGWAMIEEYNGLQQGPFPSIYLTAVGPILILGLATAAAIIAGLLRHGGWPRPADWLALALSARLLQTAILDSVREFTFYLGAWCAASDPWASLIWRARPGSRSYAVRWSLAWLASLAVFAAVRRKIPAWAGAVWITAIATMFLLGPIRINPPVVIRILGGALEASPRPIAEEWWAWLRWCSSIDLAGWPELLLFALPTTAALLNFRREGIRGRAWTEWAGLALALALATCWWLDRLSFSRWDDPSRSASLIVRGILIVGAGGASWLILRLGGVSRRASFARLFAR
jgi:drug/metabolite transporter superfamily protein YnfA